MLCIKASDGALFLFQKATKASSALSVDTVEAIINKFCSNDTCVYFTVLLCGASLPKVTRDTANKNGDKCCVHDIYHSENVHIIDSKVDVEGVVFYVLNGDYGSRRSAGKGVFALFNPLPFELSIVRICFVEIKSFTSLAEMRMGMAWRFICCANLKGTRVLNAKLGVALPRALNHLNKIDKPLLNSDFNK